MISRKQAISKARDAESRAKQYENERAALTERLYGKNSPSHDESEDKKLNDLLIPMAEAYEEAGRNWLTAKKLRKAERNYLSATRSYGSLFQSRFTERDRVEEFRHKCLRNDAILDRLEKVKKGTWHGLEGVTPVVAAVGLLGSIIFLSSNITGNVVGNMASSTSNLLGVLLFVMGIIGVFSYFRVN